MLIDIEADKLNEIYMCCGYVDLRMGINGLSALLEYTYNVDPYRENVLFLFCGKTSSWKIKGLLWEENGFLLVTKWLKETRFYWERDEKKGLMRITYTQYINLMNNGRLK